MANVNASIRGRVNVRMTVQTVRRQCHPDLPVDLFGKLHLGGVLRPDGDLTYSHSRQSSGNVGVSQDESHIMAGLIELSRIEA